MRIEVTGRREHYERQDRQQRGHGPERLEHRGPERTPDNGVRGIASGHERVPERRRRRDQKGVKTERRGSGRGVRAMRRKKPDRRRWVRADRGSRERPGVDRKTAPPGTMGAHRARRTTLRSCGSRWRVWESSAWTRGRCIPVLTGDERREGIIPFDVSSTRSVGGSRASTRSSYLRLRSVVRESIVRQCFQRSRLQRPYNRFQMRTAGRVLGGVLQEPRFMPLLDLEDGRVINVHGSPDVARGLVLQTLEDLLITLRGSEPPRHSGLLTCPGRIASAGFRLAIGTVLRCGETCHCRVAQFCERAQFFIARAASPWECGPRFAAPAEAVFADDVGRLGAVSRVAIRGLVQARKLRLVSGDVTPVGSRHRRDPAIQCGPNGCGQATMGTGVESGALALAGRQPLIVPSSGIALAADTQTGRAGPILPRAALGGRQSSDIFCPQYVVWGPDGRLVGHCTGV